jgi:hypothetical protein
MCHERGREGRPVTQLKGADQREGWEEIQRSSISIMEICYISARFLFENCRRRRGFLQAENSCLHADMENLRAESLSVSG